TTGVGMLISLLWFWFGRRSLGDIGRPPEGKGMGSMLIVLVGAAICAPVIYFLLSKVGAEPLQYVLSAMFIILAILLIAEGIREGKDQRDKVIAMILLFMFNIFFWCFFEQAGSSFNFL